MDQDTYYRLLERNVYFPLFWEIREKRFRNESSLET